MEDKKVAMVKSRCGKRASGLGKGSRAGLTSMSFASTLSWCRQEKADGKRLTGVDRTGCLSQEEAPLPSEARGLQTF